MPSSRSSSAISASDPALRDPVIRVRGLTTRFGGRYVHENLDLDVERGRILGVVGASGAGKSVLLRCIVGLELPVRGEIEVLGQKLAAANPEDEQSSSLRTLEARWGVLFQNGALFSSLTVAQNVEVPLKEHLALPPGMVSEIARLKLAMVGLPADAAQKFPSELSGGMRKRAGLARALALDPEILFLDEPTAGLDPIGAAEFDELILDLHQSLNLTVFMVTHDLDSLHAICSQIAALIDKRVRLGTIAELSDDPHPWLQAYFHGKRGRAAQNALKTG